MKKIYAITLGLVAMLAVGGFAAASASAEEFLAAENLIAGAKIAAGVELPGLVEGEVLLRDATFGAHIVCSFHADVDIINNVILVLDVLTLSGTTVGSTLTEQSLECSNEAGSNCANVIPVDIKAWPLHLPWTLETVLGEPSGKFFSLAAAATGGNVGYEVECLIFGVKTSEECTVETLALDGAGGEVVNVAAGVEGKGAVTPKANCSVGGNGVGEEEFLAGNILLSTEGTPSVSE